MVIEVDSNRPAYESDHINIKKEIVLPYNTYFFKLGFANTEQIQSNKKSSLLGKKILALFQASFAFSILCFELRPAPFNALAIFSEVKSAIGSCNILENAVHCNAFKNSFISDLTFDRHNVTVFRVALIVAMETVVIMFNCYGNQMKSSCSK